MGGGGAGRISLGTASEFVSRLSKQLTGKFKSEGDDRILQTAWNPVSGDTMKAGARVGTEVGMSQDRVNGWKLLPSGAQPGRMTSRERGRWVSPENDLGYDLVGEERTEGTVRNQQVGWPTERGNRITAGGTADGVEIWTWAGGQDIIWGGGKRKRWGGGWSGGQGTSRGLGLCDRQAGTFWSSLTADAVHSMERPEVPNTTC